MTSLAHLYPPFSVSFSLSLSLSVGWFATSAVLRPHWNDPSRKCNPRFVCVFGRTRTHAKCLCAVSHMDCILQVQLTLSSVVILFIFIIKAIIHTHTHTHLIYQQPTSDLLHLVKRMFDGQIWLMFKGSMYFLNTCLLYLTTQKVLFIYFFRLSWPLCNITQWGYLC